MSTNVKLVHMTVTRMLLVQILPVAIHVNAIQGTLEMVSHVLTMTNARPRLTTVILKRLVRTLLVASRVLVTRDTSGKVFCVPMSTNVKLVHMTVT